MSNSVLNYKFDRLTNFDTTAFDNLFDNNMLHSNTTTRGSDRVITCNTQLNNILGYIRLLLIFFFFFWLIGINNWQVNIQIWLVDIFIWQMVPEIFHHTYDIPKLCLSFLTDMSLEETSVPVGLNGHLSIKVYTLTSYQKGPNLHINIMHFLFMSNMARP